MKTIFLSLAVVCTFACTPDEMVDTPTGNWKKSDANPVLEKGEPYGFDFYAISDGWVIPHQGIYKMWYTGGGAVYPDTILHSSIGYATSADGIHWTKYADYPVLDVSLNAWDSLGVETVTVLIDSLAPAQSRYKLWYAGQTYNDYRYEIGYAYSEDGIHWTKHPEPVVQVGEQATWDNCFLEGPSVLKDGDTYKMWYAAYDCEVNGQSTDGKVNIGYATSTDGIIWTKHAGNPVLTTSPAAWDAVFVQDPHVVAYNGMYHLWYGGVDVEDNYQQQTGYAYSEDGIHWTKSSNNPVLKRGNSGSWDANTASFPSVIIEREQLKLWYTGKDVDPLPEWPAPYYWEIGYAEKTLISSSILD